MNFREVKPFNIYRLTLSTGQGNGVACFVCMVGKINKVQGLYRNSDTKVIEVCTIGKVIETMTVSAQDLTPVSLCGLSGLEISYVTIWCQELNLPVPTMVTMSSETSLRLAASRFASTWNQRTVNDIRERIGYLIAGGLKKLLIHESISDSIGRNTSMFTVKELYDYIVSEIERDGMNVVLLPQDMNDGFMPVFNQLENIGMEEPKSFKDIGVLPDTLIVVKDVKALIDEISEVFAGKESSFI